MKHNDDREHRHVDEEDSIALFSNVVEGHSDQATVASSSLRKWMTRLISDGSEEESIAQESQVLYMRNWPFALPRINESRKRETEIRLLPGVRGGWYIGVNKDMADINGEDNEANNKKLEKLAAILDLIFFMSGEEEQKKRLREDGTLPTFGNLYNYDNDDNIWEIYPAYKPLGKSLKEAIQNAVERPAKIYGTAYPSVSAALACALNQFFYSRKYQLFRSDKEEIRALESFGKNALLAFKEEGRGKEEGRDPSKEPQTTSCEL